MTTLRARRTELGWVLLPLRAFLTVVFLDAGISKIADRRFLDPSSPQSIHASVLAVRSQSPIGGLLGPVVSHSTPFGVVIAAGELAVGLGLLLGLFTPVAAAGGMLLSLSLWLTVSWGASPWYTSADVVYLLALTPFAVAGSAGVLSLDAWLDRVRERHPGRSEDRTRRTLLAGGVALVGLVVLGGASLFRRGRTSAAQRAADTALPAVTLTAAADVPAGGGAKVTDPASGDETWVLQLEPGQFTAYDATCPHQGCTVAFVSAADGFACPCHGSRFSARGAVLNGPATRGLTPIPVVVESGEVRTT